MQQVVCKFLGICEYQDTLYAMQQFTKDRNYSTIDQIWFLQHWPVFTTGKAGSDLHILQPNNIQVIKSDRGGQITYHAPGQLVIYFLIDLIRKSLSIKDLILVLQQAIIEVLIDSYKLPAYIKAGAPGVYINEEKICFIGLKVHRGCSYHGLSLNINLDLSPFKLINPCGFKNLKITQLKTQLKELGLQADDRSELTTNKVASLLKDQLCNKLGFIEDRG